MVIKYYVYYLSDHKPTKKNRKYTACRMFFPEIFKCIVSRWCPNILKYFGVYPLPTLCCMTTIWPSHFGNSHRHIITILSSDAIQISLVDSTMFISTRIQFRIVCYIWLQFHFSLFQYGTVPQFLWSWHFGRLWVIYFVEVTLKLGLSNISQ